MTDNLPTRHHITVTVDPGMAPDVIATPEGLAIRPDADPERIGRALSQWVRSARRIALSEANES